METKGFILILNHHKCLSKVNLINLNNYVMGLRPLEIFSILSESDVYRRQLLSYKDGPRTERVKRVTDDK